MNVVEENDQLEGLAIVGIAARVPDASNPEQFWKNLCAGVESVTQFSDEELLAAGVDPGLLQLPNYVKSGVLMEGVDSFDAGFFGVSPREAELTDPQHRIFLECAWEALEDAGYDSDRTRLRIGVYAGAGKNCYFQKNLVSNPNLIASLNQLQMTMAVDSDYLTSRVSYKLNLKGPSLTIMTACSTSLVAVHVACQSLLNGECDMALAGGVYLNIPQVEGYLHEAGSQLSDDGRCRAFDASAKGMVFGTGAGIVVLKRLADAVRDGDSIYAVIRGSAINNDGAAKIGYTAPSVEGQTNVIAEAQAVAGVTADEISYVEAHGTGTVLGDPIEVEGLTRAFRRTSKKNGFCALGSVKNNIGHLDAAAGVAGLIKVALALKNRTLPPTLNFKQANPAIDFANSPFFVQQTMDDWKPVNGRRIAGVSSFGIGGTNAHVILEEAPAVTAAAESKPWHVLPVAAKTPQALEKATERLAEYLESHPDLNLADVAFTLQQGRKPFAHRRVLAAKSVDEVAELLKKRDLKHDPERTFTGTQSQSELPIAFMFTGQGAQYVNMGHELYLNEKKFKETVDYCCEFLKPHLGLDLRQVLYPKPEDASDAAGQLNQTAITQPAMFVVEYAMAKLWMEWGVIPKAMIGHSIGEYVAACLAGVLTLDEALAVVAGRGRLMQSMPGGSMLAVRLDEKSLRPYLGEELSLAVINGAKACVAAGPSGAIEQLQSLLAENKIDSTRLTTSHAFHSKMMEPILESFRALFKNIKLGTPKIPFQSNVTGTWIEPAQATDPSYWSTQLRQTVRFSDGVSELLKTPHRVLLEVGPGRVLSSLGKQNPAKAPDQLVLSSFGYSKGEISELGEAMTTLGRLWIAGVPVDWSAASAGQKPHRVSLPTYPFERKRHWIDAKKAGASKPNAYLSSVTSLNVHASFPAGVTEPQGLESKPPIDEDSIATIDGHPQLTDLQMVLTGVWCEVLGFEDIGLDQNFFDLGGDSLIAVRLMARLQQVIPGATLPVRSILEAPTIERFAVWLADQRGSEQQILVQLRQGNPARTPFFCAHASDGIAIGMRPLAMAMDPEVPFYCLQAKGLDGSEPFATVEEAANYCLDEIRKVQPHGPYNLGGYCYGGLIVFEMARMLEQAGELVASLVLIDAYNPLYRASLAKSTMLLLLMKFHFGRVAVHARKLASLNPAEWLEYVTSHAKSFVAHAKFYFSPAPEGRDNEGTANPNLAGPATGLDMEEILKRLERAGPNASSKFAPKPYHGNALVIRVNYRNFDPFEDRFLGWKPVMKGHIESVEVDAHHGNILLQPAVGLMAQQIYACLPKPPVATEEKLVSASPVRGSSRMPSFGTAENYCE